MKRAAVLAVAYPVFGYSAYVLGSGAGWLLHRYYTGGFERWLRA